MKGYLVEWVPIDVRNNTLFHHKLFGRILQQQHTAKKYYYYVPGILHDVGFFRIEHKKIFVASNANITEDELGEHTINFRCEEKEVYLKEGQMLTAKDYWINRANERGIKLRNIKNG